MADDMKLQIILEGTNETAPSFEELDQSFKSLESVIQELSRALSEFTNSVSSSFREITASAEESAKGMEQSINVESQAMTNLEKAANESEKAVSSSFQGMAKSAEEASKSVASGMGEAEKSMNNLRDNINKGIDKIGGLIAVQMLGDSMEHIGKQGEHLFDYAVEQGKDFEQSMKNIQTVIAVNADGTQTWNDKLKDASSLTGEMQQKALDLGSRGAQSANEVAEAMDAMLRGGVDANTILSGAIESAQNVAIVTGDKLDESANLVTEIFHMFREQFAENGKSVQENMKTTGDVLTGTLLSARISSQDFLDTLKYVGPVASQLGAGFDDTAAAAALLAQNGIKGSQAGNNLKRALTNLLEPTKSGAAAMEHLGLIVNGHNKLIDEQTGKMKNLTDIQAILHQSLEGLTDAERAKYVHDMFGQYALAGTLVLANENSEAFQHLKEKIDGVSASDAAAAMLDTFSGHMNQLEAHVQTTAKEFGMAFIPALEQLVPIGNQVLSWLQNLNPANKEFLMGILGVGSALAVAGGALATFAVSLKFAKEGMEAIKSLFMVQAEGEVAISIFKRFATTMREVGLAEAIAEAFNPLLWIPLLIAAAVALTVVIIQNWDSIKSFLENTWNAIKEIASNVWDGLKEFFSTLWSDISNGVTDTWNSIKNYTSSTWNSIVTGIQNLWNEFKSWISSTTTSIVNGVVDSFKWLYDHNYYFKDLVDFVKKAWETLKQDAELIWKEIEDYFSTTWNNIKTQSDAIWQAIQTGLSAVWNAIVKAADTIWTPIRQFFSDIWNSVSSTADSEWSSITSEMEQWWNEAVTQAQQIWDGLKTYFTGLWNDAYNWGSTLISKFIDGIKSMAGAVADEVKSIGSSIASFLGFHDIGNNSSDSQWASQLAGDSGGHGGESGGSVSDTNYMASGGFVTGPTRAVIGEGGEPEFVSPLSTFTNSILPSIISSFVSSPAYAGGGGYGGSGSSSPVFNVYVQGNVTRNEQELANIVSRGIWNKMKQQGKFST